MKRSGTSKLTGGILVLTAATVMLAMGCANRTTRTTFPSGPVVASTTEPGVIPAGTSFTIRTNEAITGEQPGKIYSAQVEQDIQDQSGRLLAPKGSQAQLVVAQTTEAGTVGTPSMELAIRSVAISGRTYPITAAGVEQQGDAGLGANRRTAETVGGGAVLGTLIGAAADELRQFRLK